MAALSAGAATFVIAAATFVESPRWLAANKVMMMMMMMMMMTGDDGGNTQA